MDERNSGGVTPSGPGYSAELEPSFTVSAVPVSIPNADWMAFNINYQVKVKLTEAGMDALRAEHQRFADFLPEIFDKPFVPPKTDEEGYATFQLWQLFQTFGPQVTMGAKLPFETTILLPASAIEARRAETQSGSVADESAVVATSDEMPKDHRHG